MLRAYAEGRLFGTVTGDPGAPRVLALHGWARSHRDFGAVLAPPGQPALDALALDLPGFGASPPPPEPWGSERYAELVAGVLDDLAPRVVLLGHSFGGGVAVHLATARPERVAGLVLTGVPRLVPAASRPKPSPAYRLVRALHRAHLVGDARLEAARQRHGSADYRAAEGVMRGVFVKTVGEDLSPLLPSLSCPTVLVWGADDTAAPVEAARRAAAHLPSARLEVLEGVGHLTPTEAPGALRRAVLELLG